ncbi:MAG: hypothetical protein AAB436_02195 [Patescibacteria group bacterium]
MAEIQEHFRNSFDYVRDNIEQMSRETGIVKGFWEAAHAVGGTGVAFLAQAAAIELQDGHDQ